jgi:transposase
MKKRKTDGPKRQYTDEYKVEAVRLGEAVGVLEASRRLGIPDTTIWNWIRLKRDGREIVAGPAAGSAKRSAADLEAENHRLRQELANAKADLEIVKKAAAYFAKESR